MQSGTAMLQTLSFNISKLRNDASIGLDGISARFLKNCSAEIAPALASLLNR
ncbi:MAG: hypothetical protein GY696_27865 [Gammaproteobacteria bacterium]|nr:hypothetical protein [Gammaproteobacteria bacterium]